MMLTTPSEKTLNAYQTAAMNRFYQGIQSEIDQSFESGVTLLRSSISHQGESNLRYAWQELRDAV